MSVEIVKRGDGLWNVWRKLDPTSFPAGEELTTGWEVVHVSERRAQGIEWAKKNGLI